MAPSRAVLGGFLQYTLVTAGRTAFMADLSLFEKKSWCMVSKKKKERLVYIHHHWSWHSVSTYRDPVARSLDGAVSSLPLLLHSNACWSLLVNKISLGVLGCMRLKILKCCSLECMLLLMGP